MVTALLQALPTRFEWKAACRFLFPAGLLAVGVCTLTDYLQSTTLTLVAGYAAIGATMVKSSGNKKYRFAIASLVLLGLSWLVPVKTLLYLSLAFAMLFWVELCYASVHFLGVAALLLSSPAFYYTTAVFSFPIRLQLTKLVGLLFGLIEKNVQLNGAVISYQGQEFSVDTACAGLHMLSLSMLLGIMLLGLLQRKSAKKVGWKPALFYLCCLFVLNIAANIFRIILLVQFAIAPNTMMHEVIGLLCLLLYVCLPACFLARWLVAKAKASTNFQPVNTSNKKYPLVQFLLVAALLTIAIKVVRTDTYSGFADEYKQNISGFSNSVYAPGILKLQNENALVYIKFIRGFYDTEHNPAFCWRGSGYEFKDIKQQRIDGKEIYTATLIKGHEKLHTAWWYGNEKMVTTSQWEWRWGMLKSGDSYALLNVTATSNKELELQLKFILQKNLLQSFFKKQ